MDLGLKDKCVIVTGGTSGIGEATAFAFAREGARVAICGRNQEKIDRFDKKAREQGFDILVKSVEVADKEQLKAFIDGCADALGGLDVLVNNAGIGSNDYLMDTSDKRWEEIIATDLTAVWAGTRFAVPHMLKRGGGAIVSTSSISGRISTTRRGAYAVAKAGVNSLTALFAAELASKNIRVNAVAPGVIYSDMIERAMKDPKYNLEYVTRTAMLRRLGTPEEIANTILFLSSDMSSFITGEVIEVTGGKARVLDPWCSWES